MRWAASVLLVAFSMFASPSVLAQSSTGLSLRDVLRSTRASHPEIERARADVSAADGEMMSARGGFDTKAKLSAKQWVLGYYDKGQIEAMLSQPTPAWGTELYAGWRRSLGRRIPVYDGQIETLTGGEFRAGAELPLWRNGPIDQRRAEIRKSRITQRQVRLELRAFRMLLANAAAHAYWNWVAAGQKLRIERELLELAEKRDAGLRRRAEKGDAAGILAVDNQRSVLSRRARVIAAERKLRTAALKLSLFYRNAQRQPVAPGPSKLPESLPEPAAPADAAMAADIQRALAVRPDLLALRRERARADVDVDLWENQTAPDVRLWGEVAKDVGDGSDTLRPMDAAVGVTIELPIPMRKARGKARAARAKRRSASAKLRLARDKIVAEVQTAHATLDAAYRTVDLARRARRAADTLAEAERRKLDLGTSDLLALALRETIAADAAATEVDALAAYQKARADYLTATGRGLSR